MIIVKCGESGPFHIESKMKELRFQIVFGETRTFSHAYDNVNANQNICKNYTAL